MIEIIDNGKKREYVYSVNELEWLKEQQWAEESLENLVTMNICYQSKKILYDYQFLIIPYVNYTGKFQHKKFEIEESDIFFNYDNYYAERIYKTKQSDAVLCKLKNIRCRYNYVDVFLSSEHILATSKITEVVFTIQEEKKIFSYKKTVKGPIRGIWLGTFARVEQGWKFYPKFQETFTQKQELLSLYLTKAI